jgi:hypothetical protein
MRNKTYARDAHGEMQALKSLPRLRARAASLRKIAALAAVASPPPETQSDRYVYIRFASSSAAAWIIGKHTLGE